MMTEFYFDPLTVGDVEALELDAYVFNSTRASLEAETVMLASFEDERLGSSIERLDVAVWSGGSWQVLDLLDRVGSYNEIPLSYVLEGVVYDKVMVCIRKMSNMLLDAHHDGLSVYIYSVVPDEFRDLEEDRVVYGILAKNRFAFVSPAHLEAHLGEFDNRDRMVLQQWLDGRSGR